MQHGDYLQASWAIPKRKSQNKDMEFPGVLKSLWKFQESSKKEYNFHLIKNNHVEFPWVLLFGLGIPKGCSTILWNFLRWSFVFSRISKDKVTNLKIPGIFWKKYVSTTPVWIFFWNSPIILAKPWATRNHKDSPHFRGLVQVEYQCLKGRATSRRQFTFLATSVSNMICKHYPAS